MTTTARDRGRARASSAAKEFVSALDVDTRLLAMAGALVAIWVGFDLWTDGTFLTPRNLWNLAVQTSVVGIMATGMVWVIVARHIDLSVGAILGFTGMVMAWLQVEVFPIGAEWNWIAALLIGLAIGAAIGAFQGSWIAYFAVPAFIVTLGGLLIFRGLAWWVTSGRTVAPIDETFRLLGGGLQGSLGETWSWVVGAVAIAALLYSLYSTRRRRLGHGFAVRPMWAELTVGAVGVALIAGFVLVMNAYPRPRSDPPVGQGIPIPVLIMIAVAVAMSFVSNRTRFGRYVYAIGGNPEAAELAGVNTRRITLLIFLVMGLLAALGGAITTARLASGTNSAGELLELSVIASAVIGGTSLGGGVGTIAGAILGALIMQSLTSGMVLVGMQTPLQNIVIGLVLIVAVWIDTVYQRRRR